MLGHLMEWLYNGLGGIRQTEGFTSFRNIVIKPDPVGDITSTSISYDAPYGKIIPDWKHDDRHFYLNVDIPANTTAQVCSPPGDWENLTESGKKVKKNTKKFGNEFIAIIYLNRTVRFLP